MSGNPSPCVTCGVWFHYPNDETGKPIQGCVWRLGLKAPCAGILLNAFPALGPDNSRDLDPTAYNAFPSIANPDTDVIAGRALDDVNSGINVAAYLYKKLGGDPAYTDIVQLQIIAEAFFAVGATYLTRAMGAADDYSKQACADKLTCPNGYYYDDGSESCQPVQSIINPQNIPPTLPIPKTVQPQQPPLPPIPPPPPVQPPPDPELDEITQCCVTTNSNLVAIEQAIQALQTSLLSGQGGQGGHLDPVTCTQLTAQVAIVVQSLNSIVTAITSNVSGAATPIDLKPVVDAVTSIKDIISSSQPLQDALSTAINQAGSGIATAIANAQPTDVASIVVELERMRTQAWETPGFFTQLANVIGINPAILNILPQSAPADHPLGLDGHRTWFETGSDGAELGGIAPYVAKPGGLSEFAKDSPHWTLSHSLAAGFVDLVLFLAAAANDLVTILYPQIGTTLVQITDLLNQKAPDLVASLHLLLGKPAEWAIGYVTKDAATGYTPTPDNYKTFAQDSFGRAAELGLGAYILAELGGFIFGEHDRYLGNMAAMLALASGYEDIAKLQLGPFFDAAVRLPATYDANRNMRSKAPARFEAAQLFARRKITDADRAKLFGYDGLLQDYEPAITEASYRPLNPRTLANLYVDIPFPRTQVQELLQDYGVSDTHVPISLDAYEYNSVKNVRQQYVSSIIRSAELGSISEAELQSDLQGLGFSNTATNLVLLTVAQKRLDAILTLYRREISILYSTNQLSDANYVATLEAGGLDANLANGYYGIDSSKLHGKELAQQARDAAKLEAQRIRLAVSTTKTAYLNGQIDFAAMSAAIGISGLDLSVVPLTIALFQTELQARRVDTYGLLLDRSKSVLLRERVAAVKEAVIKKLLAIADARIQLQSLNVPAANTEALLSNWSSQIKAGLLPV